MVGVWPRHQRVLKAVKAEDHYIGKTHFLLLLIDLKKVLASLLIVPHLLYRITRFSSLENLVMRYIFPDFAEFQEIDVSISCSLTEVLAKRTLESIFKKG